MFEGERKSENLFSEITQGNFDSWNLFFTSQRSQRENMSKEDGASCVSQGDSENLWRVNMYAAQGFISSAQGERIYVKIEGENLKNNEHSSTR